MNALLRSILSGSTDLRSFSPKSAEFQIPIELEIGPGDGSGTEIFQIQVCSQEWLEAHYGVFVEIPAECFAVWGKRPFLVVREYSYEGILEFVNEFLLGKTADEWAAIARELNKFSLWEFDEYSA